MVGVETVTVPAIAVRSTGKGSDGIKKPTTVAVAIGRQIFSQKCVFCLEVSPASRAARKNF